MTKTTRSTKANVLKDSTNRKEEEGVAKVTKKQRGSGGTTVATAQHIDVEPSMRMTRRQSREKEEREKAEAMKNTSSSTSDLPVQDNVEGNTKKPRVEESHAVAVHESTLQFIKDNCNCVITHADGTIEHRTVGKKEPVQKEPVKKAPIKKEPVKKETVKKEPLKKETVKKESVKKDSGKSAQANKVDSAAVPTDYIVPAIKPPVRRKQKRTDPSQCLEIIQPMYNILYQHEDDFLITPYMSSQKDINNRMRGILVDWLVEVHYKFRLHPPTLWLCINMLDRYLERKPLLRNRLQLLGVTCLLIACKFEEIYPPEVHDCVFITDNAYTSEEVLTMEQSILSVLDYQLCVPTGYHFLTRYLNIINANDKIRNLAFYYAERNLQESICLSQKPSRLVSAALYAALTFEWLDNLRYDSDDDEDDKNHFVWPDLLIEETDCDEVDLLPIARTMMRHVGEEPVTTSMRHLIAAKKKYMNDKFFNVAELDPPCL